MNSFRGVLLLINVEKFVKNPNKNRVGSDNDSQDLKNTFEAMNAHVIVKDNPSLKELKNIMSEFRKMDFSPYEYVAVAYLSHGGEDDVVETADSEIIQLQKTILIPLCRVEALNNKLKWLIMQTCRGSYDFIKQTTEGPPDTRFFPRYYAKFFATSEGMRAYRAAFQTPERTEYHSFFIKYLCQRLRNEYKDSDIIKIMNETRDDVIAATRLLNLEQKPSAETNFGSQKFYLTSGFRNSQE